MKEKTVLQEIIKWIDKGFLYEKKTDVIDSAIIKTAKAIKQHLQEQLPTEKQAMDAHAEQVVNYLADAGFLPIGSGCFRRNGMPYNSEQVYANYNLFTTKKEEDADK